VNGGSGLLFEWEKAEDVSKGWNSFARSDEFRSRSRSSTSSFIMSNMPGLEAYRDFDWSDLNLAEHQRCREKRNPVNWVWRKVL
jgi:hypothetical protein